VSDHGGVDGIESGGSVEKSESGVSIFCFKQNLLLLSLKMIIIINGGESHASMVCPLLLL
jgi:hypothetical protein